MADASERPPDIIDAIEAICEKSGNVKQVGPEYYERFTKMSVGDFREIIRELVKSFTPHLKQKFADPDYTVADGCGIIKTMFQLMSQGTVQFSDKGGVCFFKPVGSKQTDEMVDEIDRQLSAGRPLIESEIRRIFGPEKS